MRDIGICWVFDVDGIITDIGREKVTEPYILDFIIKILEKGESVAFNTGRGIDWVKNTVLIPLKDKIIHPNILSNLFVVAEGGGIKAVFNQDESLNIDIDKSLKMPADLDQEVKKLVKKKYSQTMRYESKKTMITTKIKEGTPIEKYREDQSRIAEDLQRLINAFGADREMKVDLSTIGANIMYKNTGKNRGIELILEWLLERNINPQKYIAFGDSFESDIAMAQELHSRGLPVEFIYVGEENIDISKYPFPIKITQNKFEKGTLEYLLASKTI